MPADPPRPIAKGPHDATGTSLAGLSGISKLFGLKGKRLEETVTAAASPPSDPLDRWSAAMEGNASGLAYASGQMVHGRYRLIAELASGGMGITYRAWDTNVGLPVVVKMPKRELRRDREAMARFAREIEAMRAVPHESIVPITDSGDDEGCPFVAMRFLPGGSLADYRQWDDAGAPIKNQPGMLHFWLSGVAAALDKIHTMGLLHRDVKPGNVFLDAFLRPFLGDFGIAKVVDDSGGLAREATLTATQMAVGTPEYMAPELFKPRVQLDGRVDQYALAVTVYEMLCGEKPFTGSTAHIIVEHSSLPVPLLERRCPGLPRSVYEAVHRALAKKPEERFSTCGEFAAVVLAELQPVGLEADVARLLCPGCRNILKLPRRAAGRSGRCPRCKAAMNVAADLGSLWLENERQGEQSQATSNRPPQQPSTAEEKSPVSGERTASMDKATQRRNVSGAVWNAVEFSVVLILSSLASTFTFTFLLIWLPRRTPSQGRVFFLGFLVGFSFLFFALGCIYLLDWLKRQRGIDLVYEGIHEQEPARRKLIVMLLRSIRDGETRLRLERREHAVGVFVTTKKGDERECVPLGRDEGSSVITAIKVLAGQYAAGGKQSGAQIIPVLCGGHRVTLRLEVPTDGEEQVMISIYDHSGPVAVGEGKSGVHWSSENKHQDIRTILQSIEGTAYLDELPQDVGAWAAQIGIRLGEPGSVSPRHQAERDATRPSE